MIMRLESVLVTVLSVVSFPLTDAAPREGDPNAVNTSDSLQLIGRAAVNAICSSPNEPALARASSHSIINICCPPDHRIGGWIDNESRPICCSQTSFATACSKSDYERSVMPANVVSCDGPKNIRTVLAKSGVKICQAPGDAKRSEIEESDLPGAVETPYLPGRENHTPYDHGEAVNPVGVTDIDSMPLATGADLITAECFHNYVPTLAYHDSVSTINICCPFIFPQGGWQFNTDPICCPAGASREDCSQGNLLHVNAYNVKRCLGPGNVPQGTINFAVSVCKAPGSGVKRGTELERPSAADCDESNFTICGLKHHRHSKNHTVPPPNASAGAVIKRSDSQLPIKCPINSAPQVLKDLSVLYVGICCPEKSSAPHWLDDYSTPTCCVQGVNQRECLQHVQRQTVPIAPENCHGSRNGTYNKVEVCKWLPETSGAAATMGKRVLGLFASLEGNVAGFISSLSPMKWIGFVGVILAALTF